MTSKELAHALQLRLQADVGKPINKGHVYELLAAAFGYKSYAALNDSAVFALKRPGAPFLAPHSSGVLGRFVSLDYSADLAAHAANAVIETLNEQGIAAIALEGVVSHLSKVHRYNNGQWDGEEDKDNETDEPSRWFDPDDEFTSPLLLEGLKLAAEKDNPLAHFALALISMIEIDLGDEAEGSQYWYSQRQMGHELSDAAKEWAQAYEDEQQRAQSLRHHLHRASALGLPAAMLEMADRFDDASFFDADHLGVDLDPNVVAEIAAKLGRTKDVHKWLTRAAESGNIDAMRELIENQDHGDLERCWMWLYLAESLEVDLTKDEHVGIHDDGSPYDDDVGGPIYVGGQDGVSLAPITPEQQSEARELAASFFLKIQMKRPTSGVGANRTGAN